MANNHHIPNIRALLTEGFSDRQLRRLCYDVPDFRPVYDQLADSTGKDIIIDYLLEHAERTLQMDKLLTLAKEQNPTRYAEHQPYVVSTPQKPQSQTKRTPTPPPKPAKKTSEGSFANIDIDNLPELYIELGHLEARIELIKDDFFKASSGHRVKWYKFNQKNSRKLVYELSEIFGVTPANGYALLEFFEIGYRQVKARVTNGDLRKKQQPIFVFDLHEFFGWFFEQLNVGNQLKQLQKYDIDTPALPTPAPPMDGSGDVMTVGNWEIRVERIGIAEKLTGVGGKTEKAAGRFAILFLAVTNNGLSHATFIARGSLEIRDSEGGKYAENHLASAYAGHQYGTNAAVSLNPDETGFMLAVFDIPKRTNTYTLAPSSLAKSNTGVILLTIP